MLIRTATLADLNNITELESICFPKEEAASRESLYGRLKVYPDCFYLLEDNGKLIGMIDGMVTNAKDLSDAMYDIPAMHDKNGAWQMIFGLDVRPECRKHGHAGRLLRHIIAEALRHGRKGVVLTCKEHLLHYYAKFGFIDEGISDSTHGNVSWHQMRIDFKQNKR